VHKIGLARSMTAAAIALSLATCSHVATAESATVNATYARFEAGTARLVGTSELGIVSAMLESLADADAYNAMANAVSPYGNGRSAQRTVDAFAHFFSGIHELW
jgi:UDP-N-acetylglucosamine 2-epimerase